MALTSTARTRSALARAAAAAGAAALVGGAAIVTVGATAVPASADSGEILYNCTGGPLTQFQIVVTIRGSATQGRVAGDSLTLDGFQVTAHVRPDLVRSVLGGLGVESFRGQFTDFALTADQGDVQEQSVDPAAGGAMAFGEVRPSTDGIVFTAPATPTTVGPFTATVPGPLTVNGPSSFGLHLTAMLAGVGVRDIDVTCTGPGAQVDQVSIGEKQTPQPPGTGPGGTGSGGKKDDNGHQGTGSAAGGGGSAGSAGGGSGAAGGSTQGRGTLAATGVSHVVPTTAAGGLLVLLGAGLLFTVRGRRTAEAEAGEDTDS